MLSILVLEDLAMAFYLPIPPRCSSAGRSWGGLRARRRSSLAMVTVVLFVALRYGAVSSRRWSISRTARSSCSSVLGPALLVAGVASALQVSAAVGAFLLGIAISGSTGRERDAAAGAAAGPVRRDVLRGLRPEHRPGDDPAGPAAGRSCSARGDRRDEDRDGLVGRAVAGHRLARPGAGRGGAGRARRVLDRHRRAWRCRYAAVPPELAALATAYVLLMAVFGPIAARVVEPVTRWARSKVPARSAAPSTGCWRSRRVPASTGGRSATRRERRVVQLPLRHPRRRPPPPPRRP